MKPPRQSSASFGYDVLVINTFIEIEKPGSRQLAKLYYYLDCRLMLKKH